MIHDSPRVTDLVQDGKVIPQPGDSQLLIPPVLNLMAEPIAPIGVSTTSNEVRQSSFIVSASGNLNNVGAGSSQLVTIGPGLWQIYAMLHVTNTAIPNIKFLTLDLVIDGYTMIYSAVSAFSSNYLTTESIRRLNFRDNVQFFLTNPALGATEHSYYRLCIIGNKIL